jgi:catechol 2,3-dioxygenase-like lactoylglutathione lyase family enzyme
MRPGGKKKIAHTTLPVSDYSKSKAFYTQVLATLGYQQNMEHGKSAGFNDGKNTDGTTLPGRHSSRVSALAYRFCIRCPTEAQIGAE